MSNTPEQAADDSLMSRLRVLEDQPLATRAAAFDALYEELARELEGGGGPSEAATFTPGAR